MNLSLALVGALSASVAVFACGVALAGDQSAPSAPAGLRAFVLKANEPISHSFSQTPSFAWTPVRGAVSYQLQLAKSPTFSDQSVFWTGTTAAPTVASPVALPWMTGFPYAAYARVRAVTRSSRSTWSQSFGFNLRWPTLPTQLPDLPGLSRWTRVEGATGYQVWFLAPKVKTQVRVRTDSIDHRDFYDAAGTPTGPIRWRVRAERILFGGVPTGIPRASYGPWSPVYSSTDTSLGTGALVASSSVTSDATSTAAKPLSHDLTPALRVGGHTPGTLFRTYVATDEDCVNIVFTGTPVPSPAFAPRLTGATSLQFTFSANLMADGTAVTPNEFLSAGSLGTSGGTEDKTADTPAAPSTGQAATGTSSSSATTPGGEQPSDPVIDLWESGWPTGRYYWTVVPVALVSAAPTGGSQATPAPATPAPATTGPASFVAQDLELPQDACQSGRVQTFGTETAPVVSSASSPYASGLSTSGRLRAAASNTPKFYGSPLVAWKPAAIATHYQVEWSRTQYPWKKAGAKETTATAASLPLAPGTWWYRVRGVADFLPGTARLMTWSSPVRIQVASPRFTVLR